MEIRYSKHLETRLKMRGIPYELPRIVFENASRRFHDIQSDLDIAVFRTNYFGKLRNIMVAYKVYPKYILLVTIHPLKTHQMENRIKSGRWREI